MRYIIFSAAGPWRLRWFHLVWLQVGMEVAPHLKESLNKNFFDFLLTFKQVGERHDSSSLH